MSEYFKKKAKESAASTGYRATTSELKKRAANTTYSGETYTERMLRRGKESTALGEQLQADYEARKALRQPQLTPAERYAQSRINNTSSDRRLNAMEGRLDPGTNVRTTYSAQREWEKDTDELLRARDQYKATSAAANVNPMAANSNPMASGTPNTTNNYYQQANAIKAAKSKSADYDALSEEYRKKYNIQSDEDFDAALKYREYKVAQTEATQREAVKKAPYNKYSNLSEEDKALVQRTLGDGTGYADDHKKYQPRRRKEGVSEELEPMSVAEAYLKLQEKYSSEEIKQLRKGYKDTKKYGTPITEDEELIAKYDSLNGRARELLRSMPVDSSDILGRTADGAIRQELKNDYGLTDDEITQLSIYARRKKDADMGNEEFWTEAGKESAKDAKAAASIASIGSNALSSITSTAGVLRDIAENRALERAGYKGDLTLNKDNPLYGMRNYTQGIREQRAEDLNEAWGTDKAAGFVYQTAMSGADSLLAMSIGSLFPAVNFGGTINGVKNTVSLGAAAADAAYSMGMGGLMLGMGAGVDTMLDLTEKGASAETAVMGGLVSGTFEMLFEDLSISELSTFKGIEALEMAKGWSKQAVKQNVKIAAEKILGSAVTNASEEGLTELANLIYDTLANGDMSQYAEYYNNAIASGMSTDEARKEAFKDMALQVLEAAAGGALMGVGFGVGGAVKLNAQRNTTYAMSPDGLVPVTPKMKGRAISASGRVGETLQAADVVGGEAWEYKNKLLAKAGGESNLTEKEIGKIALETQFATEGNEEKRKALKSFREEAEVKRANYKQGTTENGNKTRYLITNSPITVDGKETTINGNNKVDTEGEVFTDGKNGLEFKTGDGRTVELTRQTASQIKNEDARNLALFAVNHNLKAKSANLLFNTYDGEFLASDHASAFLNIYRQGSLGTKNKALIKNYSESLSKFTADQVNEIMNAGLEEKEFKPGATDFRVTEKKNNFVNIQVKIMDSIAKALNKELIITDDLFDEYTREDGTKGYRALNGTYVKGDNRIILSAKADNGLLLSFLAHEMGHEMKNTDSDAFGRLKEKVKSYYTPEEFEEMKTEFVLKGYAESEAEEEIIANALFKVWDKDTIKKVVGKNKSLAVKLYNLVDKISKTYEKAIQRFTTGTDRYGNARNADVKKLIDNKQYMDDVKKVFTEYLEGQQNGRTNLTESETKQLADAGIGVDENTGAAFSVRYTLDSTDFDENAIAQDLAKATGRTINDAKKWLNAEHSLAAMIVEHPEYLDFEPDDRYQAIKENSDYPQGTVDLSNLCPKRVEFTTMFDMLQKMYPNKLFTAKDVAQMRDILKKNGVDVACGICFVEDRRQNSGEIAEEFIDMWKESAKTGNPLTKKSGANLKVTEDAAKQYGLEKGSLLTADDKYIPTQYDLTTYEGYKQLTQNHPSIARAFENFNNSRGQQAARLIEGRAEYKRQILSWSDAKVKKVNDVGGLRIFSFSDFETPHLLDLVQVITDCAARGVKIQGYTKRAEFARLVSKTGIKLNRSLIPAGDTGLELKNGKWVLTIDNVEGINTKDKNYLDERNNPNIGNIIIGINDKQIGVAMLDDNIDYIIPFHTNKSGDILKELNIAAWENYKYYQAEKDIKTGKRTTDVNIYTDVIQKYNPKNKVEFVNAFIEECKKQGKIPRFSQFLNVDENGNYTYREGYHKLLLDFKMFDREGNILPQGNVTPNFDLEYMKELLQSEVDKKSNYKFPQKVFDEIVDKFGENKNSISDREYFDAVEEYGADSKQVKDMVEQAAKEAFPNSALIQDGKFRKMWHHTNKEFSSFLPGMSADNGGIKGIMFTPQEHGNMSARGNIHKQYYLNVVNYKIGYGVKDHKPYAEKLRALQKDVKTREEIAEINKKYREETGIDAFVDPFNGWYTILDASLIKSADPVTYDDQGNIIPLSERFNSENEDIRYSYSDREDSDGNKLTTEQESFFEKSKIRDDNGNLLVVYHGTDKDFTVFDKTKGRSTMDIQGMFFSPWEIDAGGYGQNVGKYYLNITNPAPEDVAYKALNMYKGQNNAGVKAREYLEKLGYDGVNNGNEEYIAFNSNQIKRVDNLNPTENEDVRYSYAGNRAETADRDLLSEAEQMERDGADSETIRQKTGWFRGYDNKWRFEIDDSKATWNDEARLRRDVYDTGYDYVKLTNLMDHPELYAAYPELKNVKIYIRPNQLTTGMVYGGSTDAVFMKEYRPSSEIWRDFFTHELQHIVQNIEEFAPGSSQEMFKQLDWGEKEYAAVDKRNELADKLYAILRRHGTKISNEEIEDNRYAWTDGFVSSIINREYFKLSRLADSNKRTRELLDEYYKQAWILNSTTPYGQYMNTAGEIEANDTMGRRRLSADDRRRLRPNIDNENAIVLGDNAAKVSYLYGVTQEDINKYVVNSREKLNTEEYKKYAPVSEKLKNDVADDIDLSGYIHALRDNDIRHIFNSHGEGTNEKYPVTEQDVESIPYIVENYDKVYYKTNANGAPGIAYVKVGIDNVVYYVEAVLENYDGQNLLVNKQLLKAGFDEIPNLVNLISAINKKQTESDFLSDLQRIREAYVQDVSQNQSAENIITDSAPFVNRNNSLSERGDIDEYEAEQLLDTAKGEDAKAIVDAVDRELLGDAMYYGRKSEQLREEKNAAKKEVKSLNSKVETRNRQIAALRQKVKDQRLADDIYYQRRIKEIRDDRDQKILALKAARRQQDINKRENKLIRDYRSRIQKTYDNLSKELLKPNANRYVPAGLVKTVSDVLGTLSDTLQTTDYYTQGKREGQEIKSRVARNKRLADLKVSYDALANDKNYSQVYDPVISDMIQVMNETIGDKTIEEMNAKELEQVYTVLKAIDHTVRKAAKVEIAGREADAFKLADKSIDQLKEVKKKKINAISKFWYEQLNPRSFFRQLAGYTDGGWMDTYEILNNGQLQQTAIKSEITEAFRELTGDKRARELMDTDKLVDVGLRDAYGKPIPITRGMMISLYMHLQNEDNTRHIERGGLTVPDIDKYYKGDSEAFGNNIARSAGASAELRYLNHQLSELREKRKTAENTMALDAQIEELEERYNFALEEADILSENLKLNIERELTDYDRAWIAKAKWLFDEYSKGKLNEATMRMYGFRKANVENYMPIRTDETDRAPTFEGVKRDVSLENSGFMKDRQKGASNAIYLEDIVDVIQRQMDNVATYSGLAPAVKDFEKIYGKSKLNQDKEVLTTSSVQGAVRDTFGKYGMKYVHDLVTDLQGGRRKEPSIISTLRGNAYQAALTLNLRVAMAQAGSYPTAAAEIGWKPLMQALAKGGEKGKPLSKADRELIAKYTPLLANRINGGHNTVAMGDSGNRSAVDINNLKLMSSKSAKGLNARILNKTAVLTDWIAKVDAATVGRLWYACQYYVDAQSPNLEKGSDEYYQEVAKVFNRVVERTQPSYTTMQRSALLRNPNEAMKLFTMYMTQRAQNFNLVYDSAMEYHTLRQSGASEEKLKESRSKLGRVVSSQLAAGLTLSAMKIVADAIQHSMKGYRDDDDEVTLAKILEKLGLTWLESELSNIFLASEIYSAVSKAITGETYYGISVNVTGALTDLTKSLVTMAQNPSPSTIDKAFRNAATILGIPSSQMKKFADMGIYWFEDIKDGGGIYSYSENGSSVKTETTKMVKQFLNGDMEDYRKTRESLKGENASTVKSHIVTYLRENYVDGKLTDQEVRRVLESVYGMSSSNIDKKLEEFRQRKNGTYEKKESKKWGEE